jgi:hypothetical protein
MNQFSDGVKRDAGDASCDPVVLDQQIEDGAPLGNSGFMHLLSLVLSLQFQRDLSTLPVNENGVT